MRSAYVQCVARFSWLIDALEKALSNSADGMVVGTEFVGRIDAERLPSEDEAVAVLRALEEVGALRRCERGWRLDHAQFEHSRGYRDGVRAALKESPAAPVEAVLCIAVPPGLDPEAEIRLRSEATDLRAALMEVLAAARSRLVVASPFWDADTAADVGEMLARRLEAGIRVDVLGRHGGAGDPGSEVLDARLGHYSSYRSHAWYRPSNVDPFGVQTFHFKAVVADNGARAYLGTANLTTSGLRSRMELGVILSGAIARRLARVLDVVLALAQGGRSGPTTD